MIPSKINMQSMVDTLSHLEFAMECSLVASKLDIGLNYVAVQVAMSHNIMLS